MNRIQKMKASVKDHADEIVAVAVVVGTVALYALAIKVSIDEQNAVEAAKEAKRQAKLDRQQAMLDAIAAGHQILPNTDGTFWILPKQ